MKTLDDYAKELRTDDLIEAAHQAKEQSHELFDDQGIATLSLSLSEVLVDFLKTPEKRRVQNASITQNRWR